MHLRTHIGYTYLLLAWGLLWASACRQDVYEFVPYAPVEEDLQSLFSQVPDENTSSTFYFEGKGTPIEDTILTHPSGVRLFLSDTEALFEDDNGAPVPCSTCPDLKISALFVAQKGDLLARQLPLITYPGGEVLESAGILQIQATCSGQPLRLRPGAFIKVQIPVTPPENNMTIFSAKTDDSGKVVGWRGGNTPALPVLWPSPLGGNLQSGYEAQLPQLGWFNCARVLPEPTTTLCVELPAQFTALNSRVFLVFENTNTAIELSGNVASSRFCSEHTPVGYPASVVAIARTGQQHWIALATTETGALPQLLLIPKPASQDDVIALLKKF